MSGTAVATRATVPRLWPNSTIVCVAGGPSLRPEDVNYVHGKARVIAVNDAYRLAPWADVLYASDSAWWAAHQAAHVLPGLKYSVEWPNSPLPNGVSALRVTGDSGIETDPSAIRTGRNSGAAAINVAVHLGASRIVLLGYDMQPTGGRSHWFGDHPIQLQKRSPYDRFRKMFDAQVDALQRLGVSVVNCSRQTALTCFARQPLEATL